MAETPTAAAIGMGNVFEVGNGGSPSETFASVGQLIDLNLSLGNVAKVDGTHSESPNFRIEYIPGLEDCGTADVTLNYTDGAFDDLIALVREVKNFQVSFASGATLSLTGFITGMPLKLPIADRMTLQFTLQLNGYSFAAGS